MRPNWMWDEREVINHIPIHALMIPGSHNSGSYKILGVRKYFCQVPHNPNEVISFVVYRKAALLISLIATVLTKLRMFGTSYSMVSAIWISGLVTTPTLRKSSG